MLSPTNKSGDGFAEYQLKRGTTIRQKVHLVEIDFLLGGERLPMDEPLPPGDYYAFVSRAERPARLRRLRLDDPGPPAADPDPARGARTRT